MLKRKVEKIEHEIIKIKIKQLISELRFNKRVNKNILLSSNNVDIDYMIEKLEDILNGD